MEFCETICSRDPDCTAFQYDVTRMGLDGNCQLWDRQRFAGDGDANNLCFIKKDMVSTHDIKMVKANYMCQDYKSISDQ